jgi:hypothetical protein
MGRVPRNDPEARRRRTASASLPAREAEGSADGFEPDEATAEEKTFFFPRWFRAVCRLVGFLLLALPAVGILAALVLLPEYAAWKNDVYQRDLVAAETADLESLKEAQERLVQAAYDDPVFIKRLAMWNLNLLPANEQVLDSLLPPAPPPGRVTIVPHPRPAPPDDPFLRAAAKVSLPPDATSPEYQERAGTRRGLFVVSAGLLLFAVLLFGPGARRGVRRKGMAHHAA